MVQAHGLGRRSLCECMCVLCSQLLMQAAQITTVFALLEACCVLSQLQVDLSMSL